MAYFFYSDSGPSYLTVIADMDKVRAASTETFEEYCVTNRFGMGIDLEWVNIGTVITRSLDEGYKANVSHLDYHSIMEKNKDKMIRADKFLKYDGLPSATIMIPIVKEAVIDVFREYAADKIQVIDVVITLQDGTKIYDYKALNVINRVEAFTWEGSEKKDCYEEGSLEYGSPHIASMKIMAYKKEVVEREIICRDSITNIGHVMICEALGQELKKRKFKGLRLEHNDAGRVKIV